MRSWSCVLIFGINFLVKNDKKIGETQQHEHAPWHTRKKSRESCFLWGKSLWCTPVEEEDLGLSVFCLVWSMLCHGPALHSVLEVAMVYTCWAWGFRVESFLFSLKHVVPWTGFALCTGELPKCKQAEHLKTVFCFYFLKDQFISISSWFSCSVLYKGWSNEEER